MGDRIEFMGLHFDPVGEAGMIAALRARSADASFGYVVTPNVDHVVRLSRPDVPPDVRAAYAGAGWCLCDSTVLHRLAAWRGIVLPVVPGSDLTMRLLDDVVEIGDPLCLVGGETGDDAILATRRPGIAVVQHIPPSGLRSDPAAREAAARFAVEAQARFTLIAVGSPQQEQIAAAMARMPGARGTALCVGASIDFLAGRERRAPRWMRRASLEWLHRLLADPVRLWRRYLIEGPRIFLLAARWKKRV